MNIQTYLASITAPIDYARMQENVGIVEPNRWYRNGPYLLPVEELDSIIVIWKGIVSDGTEHWIYLFLKRADENLPYQNPPTELRRILVLVIKDGVTDGQAHDTIPDDIANASLAALRPPVEVPAGFPWGKVALGTGVLLALVAMVRRGRK